MDWDAVRSSLRGPAALVSSIFYEDFSLNPDAIERNVRGMMNRGFGQGAGFIIAPCGDGEYVTLSPDENAEVVRAVIRGSDGTLPVVAGVNSNDFRVAAAVAEGARRAGAVAVMMAPPVYYPLNDEAIIDWYERFSRSVDVGIMLYEQLFRGPYSNAGMRPALIDRLLEIPNVVAIKHVGLSSVTDIFQILDRFADRFAYIDSSGGYALAAGHMYGAAGFASEHAPWWPELEMQYWALLERGSYEEAERSRAKVRRIIEFMDSRPASTTAFSWVSVLKACLEYAGLEGGVLRPPFRALNAGERDELYAVLDTLGSPSTRSTLA